VQEKRVHNRAPISLDISCEDDAGNVFVGSTRDISMGGMYVESESSPAFGAKVTILCHLPGATAPTRLPAIVRWAKPDGFGVQFGLLGAKETHLLANLMRA
jgi:hypothetical protein